MCPSTMYVHPALTPLASLPIYLISFFQQIYSLLTSLSSFVAFLSLSFLSPFSFSLLRYHVVTSLLLRVLPQ